VFNSSAAPKTRMRRRAIFDLSFLTHHRCKITFERTKQHYAFKGPIFKWFSKRVDVTQSTWHHETSVIRKSGMLKKVTPGEIDCLQRNGRERLRSAIPAFVRGATTG
jgi:hypothetical protein